MSPAPPGDRRAGDDRAAAGGRDAADRPHGADDRPSTRSGARRTHLSRRGLLAAVGASTALSAPVLGSSDERRTADGATIQLRIYPGPTPILARARDGPSGLATGWTGAHRDAAAAVEGALDRLSSYAAATPELDALSVDVERRAPLGSRFASVVSPLDAVVDAADLMDAFREHVQNRDLVTGDCCHLLLWWGPLHYDLGYGGTRAGTGHVAARAEEGAHVVANVGATEIWDSRAVTRNIAIHETLHAFLAPAVVETVVDSRCDHDLGTAVETEPGVREVSPMATAYAGPPRLGGGTRWHGTGCYDHDAFARHDGTDDVSRWTYTTTPSEATLEAATRYVRRHLAA